MNKHAYKKVILVGAGGHAKVVLDILNKEKFQVFGVCDPKLIEQKTTSWRGLKVLGDDTYLSNVDPAEYNIINGVGAPNALRKNIFLKIKKLGFYFQTLVHSFSYVAPSVQILEGAQIFAGSIIQADCKIGQNTIVNTGSRIDHDCVVEDHAHIAPGSTLCGNVYIGRDCLVGSGSTFSPGAAILSGLKIKAGSLVTK